MSLVIPIQVLIQCVLTSVTSVKWATSDKLLRGSSLFCRYHWHMRPVCWYSGKYLEQGTILTFCMIPPSRGRKGSGRLAERVLAEDNNPVLHYPAENQMLSDHMPEPLPAAPFAPYLPPQPERAELNLARKFRGYQKERISVQCKSGIIWLRLSQDTAQI